MSFENFNQTGKSENHYQSGLNLCDLLGAGRTLKSDLTNFGPGLLDASVKCAREHPGAVLACGAAGALISVAVLAESPIIIGAASFAGLTSAGWAILDTVVPKVSGETEIKH